jgi:hypothetical protein
MWESPFLQKPNQWNDYFVHCIPMIHAPHAMIHVIYTKPKLVKFEGYT